MLGGGGRSGSRLKKTDYWLFNTFEAENIEIILN